MPITNYKRRFDSKETLKILEKLLITKKMKPTGFDRWSLPDISWMLRSILYLEPTAKKELLNYKKSRKKSVLEDL